MIEGASDLIETRLTRIGSRSLACFAKWFRLHAGGLHEGNHVVDWTAPATRRQYLDRPNGVKTENEKKPNM